MSIIRTDELSKSYGKQRGVDELSFEVRQGEVFGFLGPNGAGKTTTIRTLLSLLKPTSGTAIIFGLDSQKDSIRIHQDIGYLPGELALYPDLTGRQMIQYLAGLRGGADWEYISKLTKRIECDLDKRLHSLSTGNKRKVGLIQALMHKPRLLIMDEPTSGLDPLIQQVFYELIAEAKANGQTVFVSSHNLPEVEKICDRVAFIRKGRLLTVEDVAEVKAKSYQIIEAVFADKVEAAIFRDLTSIKDLEIKANRLTCTLIGEADELIKAVARYKLVKFITHDPHLEDVFMAYYGGHNDAE